VGLFSAETPSAFTLFILQVGWVERSETQQVSELQVSKGKVELRGCLVQSHPQQPPRRRHFSAESRPEQTHSWLKPFLQAHFA